MKSGAIDYLGETSRNAATPADGCAARICGLPGPDEPLNPSITVGGRWRKSRTHLAARLRATTHELFAAVNIASAAIAAVIRIS